MYFLVLQPLVCLCKPACTSSDNAQLLQVFKNNLKKTQSSENPNHELFQEIHQSHDI